MNKSDDTIYFFDPENRATKQLIEGIMIRSFWGENLTLAVVDLDPNTLLSTHRHPNEQGGIILDGEIEFTIADQTRQLKAGDVYLIPGGVEHSVRTGDKPVRLIDIFSPVREDMKY